MELHNNPLPINGETKMEIIQLKYNTLLWKQAIDFAENSSWTPGRHIAGMLRENRFTDWEAFFVSIENDNIIAHCSFLKEDYYPENRYSPWISSIFVTENARGKRVSHKMIQTVITYAQSKNFSKVYIPSDMKGFYEKCGFTPIDTLKNYAGDYDAIFLREI